MKCSNKSILQELKGVATVVQPPMGAEGVQDGESSDDETDVEQDETEASNEATDGNETDGDEEEDDIESDDDILDRDPDTLNEEEFMRWIDADVYAELCERYENGPYD